MRKQWFKVIVTLVCLALLAAPAMANNLAKHVTVAPNAKGDLLVYPMYLAVEGMETNMEVINTSNTESVVAKVVLRSQKYSQEVLDFLIFLSPNDVFKGTVKFKNGEVVFVSTDDSVVVGTPPNCKYASVDDPFEYPLADPCRNDCCDGDDNAFAGYIEVFEACNLDAVSLRLTGARLAREVDGTVAKETMCTYYYNARALVNVDETPDVLTGHGELVLPGIPDYALYPATVFADYDNTDFLVVGRQTILGQLSDNNLCEVEATLSKNNLVLPYYNDATSGTVPIFTFPTKLSLCPLNLPDSARGPFFNPIARYNPKYGLMVYNMKEETPQGAGCLVSPCNPGDPDPELEAELNLVELTFPSDYTEGWARVVFGQTTDCDDLALNPISYSGAPIIAMVAEITPEGLSLLSLAYDYGTVTYNGVVLAEGAYQKLAVGPVPPPPPPPAVDCTPYADKAACNADADCTWAQVSWGEFGCVLDCAQFGDEAACTAGYDGNCRWIDLVSACAPK